MKMILGRHIKNKMATSFIGLLHVDKVNPDPEYEFESDYKIAVKRSYNEFFLEKDGETISISYYARGNTNFKKFITIGLKKWIIFYDDYFVLVYFINNKIIKQEYDYQCKHVTQKGVYFQSYHNLRFLNFEDLSVNIILEKYSNTNFYIVKKFIISDIISRSGYKHSHVYIHDQNLPENFSHEMFLATKKGPLRFLKKETPEDKKALVHFNDISKYIGINELKYFDSEFLDDQIKDGDEIFLNLNFEDFHYGNLETLKYLNSKHIGDLYKKQLLEQLKTN